MLLPTNDGIRCDRCGHTAQQDFTYYSFDFQELQIRNTVLPKPNRKHAATFSLDICGGCMDEIGSIVTKNYKPFKMTPDRRCPGGVYCDLSGAKITSGRIYYCHVIKVKVHTSGLSITCEECGTPTKNADEPCLKCGHASFSRSADTQVDEQWLELWVSEKAYEEFKAKAIKLRTSEGAKWSASSE